MLIILHDTSFLRVKSSGDLKPKLITLYYYLFTSCEGRILTLVIYNFSKKHSTILSPLNKLFL